MADSIRQRHEHQALHLGTYEAAIESMLRKMRDEDAGGVQFWLYRVALRDRTMIKPGYCNETFEDISQITQEGLGDWGAIRYLNTWESPGSISLAVRPQALAAVQGIPLPVQALSTGAAPSLIREVARIRDQISQIEATRQDEPDWLEKTRQRLAARQGETLERAHGTAAGPRRQHRQADRRRVPAGSLAACAREFLRRDVRVEPGAGPAGWRCSLHREIRPDGDGADPAGRHSPGTRCRGAPHALALRTGGLVRYGLSCRWQVAR